MRIRKSVVIQQPHFLPWPPYLAKLALCETLVVQDNVLFRKGYFHNRTVTLDQRNTPMWLTLPVHAHSTTTLANTTLDDSKRRLIQHVPNVLHESYRTAPCFASVWPAVKSFMNEIGTTSEMSRLTNVNIASIVLLLNFLNITPPRIIYASQLSFDSQSRTDRLINTIKSVGAEVYLTGWGASLSPTVHDVAAISNCGIRIVAISKGAALSIEPQLAAVTGLSTLHWLFTMRAMQITRIILSYGDAVMPIERILRDAKTDLVRDAAV